MKNFFKQSRSKDSYFRAGAGVVLLNSKNECLLFERSDIPGNFQCSQGGIDTDEQAQDAAIRELYEETGISESSITLLGEYPEWLSYTIPKGSTHHKGAQYLEKHGYQGQTQRWFYARVADDLEIDLSQAQDEEFISCKWVPIVDTLDEIIGFKKEMYTKIIEHFQKELL